MAYTKTTWVAGGAPGISAANLNNLETQYDDAMADGGIPYATDTSGSANTIVATVSPAPASYTDGYSVRIKVANTTTGATTLNLNGISAVAVKNADGTSVGSGDLVAGVPRIFTYVGGGTPAFIASGSGGLSASGNATAADVLAPYTFTSVGGRAQSGTMPNNGQKIITPSTVQQAIALGYHDGTGYVVGDSDLVAANILSGKSIFNVAGSAQARNYASGSATSDYYGWVTVSGLSFTPKTVVIFGLNAGSLFRLGAYANLLQAGQQIFADPTRVEIAVNESAQGAVDTSWVYNGAFSIRGATSNYALLWEAWA